MPNKESKFFVGLPRGKTNGFCEPTGGDIYHSTVVDIGADCRHCSWLECHMFTAKVKNGYIVGRKFKNHPPEY